MREKSKTSINIEWLSDCGGCHVAIVDLHEKILELLDHVSIQHCPVLTDIKEIPPAEIGIVSGAIRTEHDLHVAREMREKCRLVIAWGTCAVYGGISGAGTVHSRKEILDTVYVNNKTTRDGRPPSHHIAPMEKSVTPIDEVIDVDLYLPGCPPHPSFIYDALISLVEQRSPRAKKNSVCARCRRKMIRTTASSIKAHHEGIPEGESCFLSQGYICLGSVTLDRCVSPCPNNGVMCTGCSGPTMQILTEPNRDIRTEIADRMSRLTKIRREDIISELERTSKTHYSYAMASKMIGGKPTFLIQKWITDMEAGNE